MIKPYWINSVLIMLFLGMLIEKLFGRTELIIFSCIAISLEILNWRQSSYWVYDSYLHKKIFRGMIATTFGKYTITKHRARYWANHYYTLEQVERHEHVHVQQYAKWSVIGFLLIYLINFIINLIWYCNFRKAYHNILFERQAYKEAHK